MAAASLRFAYTVCATLPDAAVRDEFVAWLTTGGHIADVIAAGALDGQVVLMDDGSSSSSSSSFRVEARYHFASRAAFDAYIAEHAPRLRADGLARFPPERGVSFARSTGTVLFSL